MTKELARTLTVALVSYLDENRPEGTMDCSSGECVSLEKAFTNENFDSVETLINKKLSRLTEFEEGLVTFYNKRNEIPSDKDGVYNKHDLDGFLHESAKTLLALAKKELARRNEVITLDNLPPYDKGFQDGKTEALKDLPVWRIWGNGACGNSEDIPIAIVKRYDGYKLVSCLGVSGEKYIMLSELEKLPGFNEPEHFPATAINIPTWTPPCYNGGPCTNPHKDCINCPRANMVISPNTASGTSTSKAEG